jgi:ribosomal protein S18 acetylase RimI-like enzyme
MVRVDNRPAIRFYRGFGFRRVGEVPGYYEDGRTGLRMRRRLQGPPLL